MIPVNSIPNTAGYRGMVKSQTNDFSKLIDAPSKKL